MLACERMVVRQRSARTGLQCNWDVKNDPVDRSACFDTEVRAALGATRSHHGCRFASCSAKCRCANGDEFFVKGQVTWL